MKTIAIISVAAFLAATSLASAASIRECNEREITFAAKRACAGTAGTGSISGASFKGLANTPSNPGGGGEDPGTDPTHPGDHGPGKGWGKHHGHFGGWGKHHRNR